MFIMKIAYVDTLCATVDISNYGENKFDGNKSCELIARLELEKEKSKAISALSNQVNKIQIGDQAFELLSNGSSGYAYILHNEYYEIRLKQYKSSRDNFYPVFVRVKSECLWSMGVKESWDFIKAWITANIGKINTNKVNRADICCHTDELILDSSDIDTFMGRFQSDMMYRHKRRVTGMTFGSRTSGKIMCRIYDKTLEVRQKKEKTWFFDIWQKSELDIENVWNVEFELQRDLMKELNLETVEDVFSNLKSLWNYCTENWLIKKVLDNERMTRCSVDERWCSIQKSFDNFEGKTLIVRDKQMYMSAMALIPGTIGNITSFAARSQIDDIDKVLEVIKAHGNVYLHSKDKKYEDIIKDKRLVMLEKIGGY